MSTPALNIWGCAPSARYEQLAAPFRPLFAQILAQAAEADQTRASLTNVIQQLNKLGLPRWRLPVSEGGQDATLVELLALLTELSAADSNITQALRGHFGFCEDVLCAKDLDWRAKWLHRLGQGALLSPGSTEVGNQTRGDFDTRLHRDAQGTLRISGKKFYTTGALYSDLINTIATGEDGTVYSVVVDLKAPGVQIIDDWNGFGQRLTASGTCVFDNAPVEDDLRPTHQRFGYGQSFFQIYHLSTLAGIARRAALSGAQELSQRARTFTTGNADTAAHDVQLLQVIGEVASQAYAAQAISQQAAQRLEQTAQYVIAHEQPLHDDDPHVALAELEVCLAVNPVVDATLAATTALFDALGASATASNKALDRLWRNARTLANHNPRVYKSRIVGNYLVNGLLPPAQWRVGVAKG
ncbi:acyl-CoA dehydrogenase family protein [Pseudomonas sp. M5A4_2d]|jgi:alkylation response protein AidB-like acyl-CoA dehydrogenase|uniref:Acyl-CoA dehydrogenase n=1 Tax=Pseudomonas antarctica TaxID=219572 RepID=A0A172Z4M4_9PSED|nr:MULTISPECIES: acyl-CoA dehydrogenase family protein [Pseudomonas]ANF87291.1 acyl-CoA dehydrogenase [Pseudomonas antarctica]MBX7277584.1 acyl-CoA dehydrogenase [Pseudomonas sp. ERGC3:01]QZC96893.1 acyl-CoA dehydrogenase [Pseudomonas sp. ERGC3:05]UXV17983.1 acyl-CoA dehydrogenase [Pseudomonas fluorescens]